MFPFQPPFIVDFALRSSHLCRATAAFRSEPLVRGAEAPIVGDAQQWLVHLAPLHATQVDEEATVSYDKMKIQRRSALYVHIYIYIHTMATLIYILCIGVMCVERDLYI